MTKIQYSIKYLAHSHDYDGMHLSHDFGNFLSVVQREYKKSLKKIPSGNWSWNVASLKGYDSPLCSFTLTCLMTA